MPLNFKLDGHIPKISTSFVCSETWIAHLVTSLVLYFLSFLVQGIFCVFSSLGVSSLVYAYFSYQ